MRPDGTLPNVAHHSRRLKKKYYKKLLATLMPTEPLYQWICLCLDMDSYRSRRGFPKREMPTFASAVKRYEGNL